MATCRTTTYGRPWSRPPTVCWRVPSCVACLMRGASTLRPVPLCCVGLLAFYSFSVLDGRLPHRRFACYRRRASPSPNLRCVNKGQAPVGALGALHSCAPWCAHEHSPSTVRVSTQSLKLSFKDVPCHVALLWNFMRSRTQRLASASGPKGRVIDALKALRYLSPKRTPP